MMDILLTLSNLFKLIITYGTPGWLVNHGAIFRVATCHVGIKKELEKIQDFGESFEWGLQPKIDGNLRPYHVRRIVRHFKSGNDDRMFLWGAGYSP